MSRQNMDLELEYEHIYTMSQEKVQNKNKKIRKRLLIALLIPIGGYARVADIVVETFAYLVPL